jgi:hypothetical protein
VFKFLSNRDVSVALNNEQISLPGTLDLMYGLIFLNNFLEGDETVHTLRPLLTNRRVLENDPIPFPIR